jgi:hypothetical protein
MNCRRFTDQREIMRVSLASKNIALTPEVVYGDPRKADELKTFITTNVAHSNSLSKVRKDLTDQSCLTLIILLEVGVLRGFFTDRRR